MLIVHNIKFIFLFLIVCLNVICSQVVYEPLKNDVYYFLERLSVKKIVKLDDEAKPYSRKYIASKLNEISLNSSELNKTETNELQWFKENFSYELKDDVNKRWYLFSYKDSVFNLQVSPDVGYGFISTASKPGHIRWPGISIYGTYSDWFGSSFSYKDIGEFGNNIDKEKKLSPITGAFYEDAPDGFEYSDVNGSINFNWNWGSISLIKDYTIWGHGVNGQLILSDKAPSFPQLRLHLKPVSWLRFNYLHGWLNSLVPDSGYFYYSDRTGKEPFLRKKYKNKYITANMLTVSPYDWLDVSLGNSFIYGGDLRPEMFIPFMYYKVMDHATGREGIDDGNGQIFFDLAVKYSANYFFYSTLFLDCLDVRHILSNKYYDTWYGFTIGGMMSDLFIDNFDLLIEFTHIGPWVYEHKDEALTYTHYGYTLGHWIGQNAEDIKIQFNYTLLRGLRFSIYVERMQKGGLNDIYYAYYTEDELPFLYEPRRKDYYFGFEGKYEVIHDLFIKANYKYSDISDEDPSRTLEFMLGKTHNFGLFVYYGIN
jgi:hypothetical protein